MTPTQLKTYLNQLVNQDIKISTMIWGAPRIGKSSIVAQIADEHNIDFVDVRLSQLAPTDLTLYKTLPNLVPILQGKGSAIAFPEEPSVRYATTTGLTVRAQDAYQAYNAFNWLSDKASAEWVQLFAVDMFRQMRSKGQMGALAKLVKQDSQLQKFLKDFQELVGV